MNESIWGYEFQNWFKSKDKITDEIVFQISANCSLLFSMAMCVFSVTFGTIQDFLAGPELTGKKSVARSINRIYLI